MTILLEQEENGRWIAEVPELPGTLAYGQTRDEAIRYVQALALRVLADRLEHGEPASGVPLEIDRLVEDIKQLLRQRDQASKTRRPRKLPDISSEPFIGMWRDREDMQDSVAWVRKARQEYRKSNH